MRRTLAALLAGATAVALSSGATVSAAADTAAPARDAQAAKDNLDHPLGTRQAALRAKGLEMKLAGKTKPGATVAEVAKGQFVELAREGEAGFFAGVGLVEVRRGGG